MKRGRKQRSLSNLIISWFLFFEHFLYFTYLYIFFFFSISYYYKFNWFNFSLQYIHLFYSFFSFYFIFFSLLFILTISDLSLFLYILQFFSLYLLSHTLSPSLCLSSRTGGAMSMNFPNGDFRALWFLRKKKRK